MFVRPVYKSQPAVTPHDHWNYRQNTIVKGFVIGENDLFIVM